MIKYNSQKQLSIFDFHTEFHSNLDPENRWVKMANMLDWDKLAEVYAKSLSSSAGAGSIDARVVIGSLIIKHIEKRDDRGTIEIIQENPYMQYFLGFDHFSFKPVFDPSLFVHIRKRLGAQAFDQMNKAIISGTLKTKAEKKDKKREGGSEKENTNFDNPTGEAQDVNGHLPNKGKLQVDATVCDAYIKYPTDLNLLNESREKAEELLDKLVKVLSIKIKPRTYRRVARKAYLNIAKKKNKSLKLIRQGLRQQLGYLKRDIGHIRRILDGNEINICIFSRKENTYWQTIQELYRQQEQMYRTQTNTIDHRIVSIHQPFIRPIVRGKDGKKVEFGSKINVSLMNGYTLINQFEYEAFNESTYLQNQVEEYKKLHGYYPELVQSDDIYMTRANREYLKAHGIRHTGRPLGRKPKKEVLTPYQKRKQKKEKNERNQIEGKFGQGKAGYNLNKIMARLSNTHESWVASIVFVMNILRAMKDIFFGYFSNRAILWLFSKKNHQNISVSYIVIPSIRSILLVFIVNEWAHKILA